MDSRTDIISLLLYIVRRLLMLLPTLIGLLLIIFALVQMLPIEKRAMLFIQDVKQLRSIPQVIEEYGLNKPVYIQFATWMGQVLRGNLGWSQIALEPVWSTILKRLPASLELALYSVPIILFLGICLGVISARYQGRLADNVSRLMAMIGQALPVIWFSIVLLAVFYGGLRWFPPDRYGNEVIAYIYAPGTPWRWYTELVTIDALLNGQAWIFADALRHLVLPVMVLVIGITPIIMKVIHSTTLETLKGKHIASAKVKGPTQNEVTWKHMLINALLSVFTLLGLLFASMVTSIIIAETIFNFPGIGSFAATAAIRLDIAPVIGLMLFLSFVFVVIDLIVDIAHACIDPGITRTRAAKPMSLPLQKETAARI